MRISIIVAMERNRGIGLLNSIPWAGKVPADMKHFKSLTTGHPVIMGKNTYLSIGRALPDRTNIVLSTDPKLELPDARVAESLDAAIALCASAPGNDEAFIIGGAQVYRDALPKTDRLYLTILDASIWCDAYFPAYDPALWKTVSSESVEPDKKNLLPIQFLVLEKKTAST